MGLIIQKYGGSSVASLERIKAVADHIKSCAQQGNRLVVTISAMGSQTDELSKLAIAMSPNPPRRELDMLLTAGERISMALLSIALHDRGVDAVSLTGSQCGILTDQTHGNARITKILGDRIRSSLNENRVVIVAGFQGVSPATKEITTLGRGGSDLSAIALAATLKADKCQLFKDVENLMTADPRYVKSPKPIMHISWQSMNEMAWAGANVLHPRGAHLAQKFEIPFEIRSSFNLEKPGTIVKGTNSMEQPQVKSLAHKPAMNLLSFKIDQKNAHKIISKGIHWLWEKGESPLINQTSTDSNNNNTVLIQLIPENIVDAYRKEMANFGDEEKSSCTLSNQSEDLCCISIIGEGFQQSPEVLEKVLALLDESKLTPSHMTYKNTAITLCVAQDKMKKALNALHSGLLEV